MIGRSRAVILAGDGSLPLSSGLQRGESGLLRSVPYSRAVTLLFEGCPGCGNQALTLVTNGAGEESDRCRVLGARCPGCRKSIGFRRAPYAE